MSLPAVTLRRNGTTSSGFSGPPKETSSRASYGCGSSMRSSLGSGLMLTSYRRVFAHPGAVAFSATGLVARLPISMMTLGIVLLVAR